MPSFNQVMLMGNVTRDPQLKQLPGSNQTVAAEFGLAINRKYRTGDGEDREETCFVDCTAFGKQAEVIAQYVEKGKPLFVQGRLRYDAWEDRQSGAKRSKLGVVVENFQFVGGRDGSGSYEGAAANVDRGERPRVKGEPPPKGETGTGERRRTRVSEPRPRVMQEDIPF
jgi:single-strand DNA-binding protein